MLSPEESTLRESELSEPLSARLWGLEQEQVSVEMFAQVSELALQERPESESGVPLQAEVQSASWVEALQPEQRMASSARPAL